MAGLNIEKAEEHYNAKYVGFYDTPKNRNGCYVFYKEELTEKEIELEYSNYLGLYWMGFPGDESLWVCNAKSIEDAVYNAIKLEDGSYIVSRFRHDYQTGPLGEMVDGGIDYCRLNMSFPITHEMRVINGKEVFTEIKHED